MLLKPATVVAERWNHYVPKLQHPFTLINSPAIIAVARTDRLVRSKHNIVRRWIFLQKMLQNSLSVHRTAMPLNERSTSHLVNGANTMQ